MQHHYLGNSSLYVSVLSFGCMSLGEDHGTNARLIHQAHDGGINLFDTADLYQKGFNEETVGRAIKGRRDKVILATKVGNEWMPDGLSWRWNPTKQYILSAVEKSLRRLDTDYIDLYQLHGGTIDDPIDEVIEAFELLVERGWIRAYGISSIRPNVIREYVTRSRISSVMMQYSLLDRRPEEMAFPLLAESEVSVLVRGGLAKGLLVDKPARPYLDYETDEISAFQAQLADIAGEDYETGHLALQFARFPTPVASVVAGIRTPEQLAYSLIGIRQPQLNDAFLEALSGGFPALQYQAHR
ncbi:MAG: aldo/keto reductase [Bacteroidota bacterium]